MCNCWGRRQQVQMPAGATVKPVVSQVQAPPRIAGDGKKCEICNYEMKKVRYVDGKTFALVERYICTKPGCPNHY